MSNSQEDLTHIVEIWKKTVEVQQHFNDIELRIRNFAITILGVILGATGFAIRADETLPILGVDLPLSVFLLIVAAIVWFAFWFMDRHWYHRLLIGAVVHGLSIEGRMEVDLPEICLARTIGRFSEMKIFGKLFISADKLDFFYFSIGLMLLFVASVILMPMSWPFGILILWIILGGWFNSRLEPRLEESSETDR